MVELLQVGAVTGRKAIDLAQGRLATKREGDAACFVVFPFLEQVQGKGHKGVTRLADPELLVVRAVRVEHGGDAHQVGDAERRVRGHIGQRVPAMGAAVFGEGVEEIDLLPLRGAPTGGELEVFLLDVQYDHRLLVLEQVGNDHAHALAGASRGRQDHELLTAQAHQVALELAHDNAVVGGLEHAVLVQVAGVGKTRVTMHRLLLGAADEVEGNQPENQWQAEADIAANLDLADVRRDLWQVKRTDIAPIRLQPQVRRVELKQPQRE